MKKSTKGYFNQLTEKEIHSLTTMVVETVAVGVVRKQERLFTTADLWNIQRLGKSRLYRRYF